MEKIKKIKIKLNGKEKQIAENSKISKLIIDFKIPIKKVAIELNQEILDKKKLHKIKLKKNDRVEIVHFIGGG
ncbi:sulfur carrier protein ThiS [Candidatus Pelagibacter sp.]|nr:sulfur carrier protein ThiS [Candidatus Pelagibacter sp.]